MMRGLFKEVNLPKSKKIQVILRRKTNPFLNPMKINGNNNDDKSAPDLDYKESEVLADDENYRFFLFLFFILYI